PDPVYTWLMILELKSQLETVRTDNDYLTDLGAIVSTDDVQVDADGGLVPQMMVGLTTDTHRTKAVGVVEYDCTVLIQAVVALGQENGHNARADLRRLFPDKRKTDLSPTASFVTEPGQCRI